MLPLLLEACAIVATGESVFHRARGMRQYFVF